MNIRFWSSWFIIIAFFTVALTMGCEKGSLGVKPATVVGRLVDASDPTIPIAGAVIRMIGKEAVGSSDLQQVNTFVAVYSNADGYFIFENVTPDNVIFQISAQGYLSTSYPETVESTVEESGDESGDTSTSTSASDDIESVPVRSGAMVDLRQIKMKKSSTTAKSRVNIKLDLVDKATREAVDSDLYFMVSANNQSYSMSASDWRDVGADMDSANNVELIIMNTDRIYAVYNSSKENENFKFSSDLYQRIELTPLSFELLVRAINVPDYLQNAVEEGKTMLNVFAEMADTKPAQIIASQTIAFPIESANTFFNIPLSNAQRGLKIRAQVRGYEDIVAEIAADKFSPGKEGAYRLDIDFLKSATQIDFDSSDWVIGAYDKIKWRMCRFNVHPILPAPDEASVVVSLPSKNPWFSRDEANSVMNVYMDIASGFTMNYSVYRKGQLVATSPVEGVMVNPESSETSSTLVYGIELE
jgi:hypothetical protein